MDARWFNDVIFSIFHARGRFNFQSKKKLTQQTNCYEYFITSLLTTSDFTLPSSVAGAFSAGLITSMLLALSAGDSSPFDRFNCECSQHLVDVHIFAYFFKIAFSAAITSSYDGGI